jgi:ABC-type uncharacterized transport system ATPase subunit
VRQSDEAMRYLKQSGWAVESQNGHVKVVVHSHADVAAINTALVQQGMHVYHLSLQQPSLEDLFLKMTGEAAGS